MNDENTEAAGETDLLGDPVDLRHENVGAPDHGKTEENQMLVSALRAAGWTQERVARFMEIDPKTLRKHYSRELAQASDLIEGAALRVMAGRMLEGNIAAARKMLDLADAGRAAVPLPDVPAPAPEAEEKAAPLGKKQRQLEAAKTPTAGWGNLLTANRPN
jgi:hypothetical protein